MKSVLVGRLPLTAYITPIRMLFFVMGEIMYNHDSEGELHLQIIPKDKAKELGMKVYFTGKPCFRGHYDIRHVSDGNCLSCKRERKKNQEVKERSGESWFKKCEKKISEHENFKTANFKEGFCWHLISRSKAREIGMQWYFHGRPCRKGHFSPRQVSDQSCVMCKTEQGKSAKARAWSKRYREENKEYIRERYKEWRQRESSRELKRNYQRRYEKERRSSDPMYAARLRMKSILSNLLKLSGTPKEGRTHEMLGYSLKEFKAHIDGRMLEGMSWEESNFHIDHIYPVTRYLAEGVDDPSVIHALSNLAPMWPEHNISKFNHTLEDWLHMKGKDSEEWKLYSYLLDS